MHTYEWESAWQKWKKCLCIACLSENEHLCLAALILWCLTNFQSLMHKAHILLWSFLIVSSITRIINHKISVIAYWRHEKLSIQNSFWLKIKCITFAPFSAINMWWLNCLGTPIYDIFTDNINTLRQTEVQLQMFSYTLVQIFKEIENHGTAWQCLGDNCLHIMK